MTSADLLTLYTEDSLVKTIADVVANPEPRCVQIKGLRGSLDAVLAVANYQLHKRPLIFVMHDRDEAGYFQNDLQFLLGSKVEVLLFPSSWKHPYAFDATENANVLLRAEVLNKLNKSEGHEIIVTYPEALTEKVVNKRSLKENTFSVMKGEMLDVPFMAELLQTYDFEPTDFVYEAGQYAIRGGIVDVFSYANELPYRIELFGKEVESIRTFDPVSQLSVDDVESIHIIPNVQTKLIQEERQSLLDFIPEKTLFYFKDYQQLLDILDTNFEKASQNFDKVLQAAGQTKVVLEPEQLFETSDNFKQNISKFSRIEWGNRFYLNADESFEWEAEPQQSFNKNFELMGDTLEQHASEGLTNIIVAEQVKQLERLTSIFEEINPHLKFRTLNLAFRQGFIDRNVRVACFTDHQLFDRYHQYRTKKKYSKSKALTLKELRNLHPGDFVTHVDYGIGKFAGLEKIDVNGKEQEAVRLVYRDDDLLYVSIHSLHKISKFTGKEGTPPQISKLGSQEWENKKKKAKKKVKDIAKDLIELYAKRKNAPGYAFSEDGFMQAELESSFIYEDTPDQAKATSDVKDDMELQHPMDRLVCGDVGFGKTEVAIRAAFKAVVNGKQVAVLVPTTVLAMQHYRTFAERLSNFPVTCAYINRFKTSAQIKDTLHKVKEGKIDILIGTHRIVNKDVEFKDLGLLVIDEEQKFGVKTKDRLKEMRVNVDVLTLTATPIPRTLHFSLMGARDLSVIATPPPNRQPVTTELHSFNEEIIRDAVSFELRRGGQCFFVHNRIADIDSIAALIKRMVPDARMAVAHGQMEGPKLEKIMVGFIEHEFDVLVSTNIIESGLDIPNANTIMINRAHMFGLSDLHQMRGRVGRSNRKAFCYLLTPPVATLTSDARKRLSTLEEFSDLGDGFKVAMRDLDIRGAGNLLGAEQSGFISDLGFDMYHKILDEAVQELKETEFRDLFEKELTEAIQGPVVQDCSIETDMELLIPDSYVNNISERLSLYNRLDNIKNEEQLAKFTESVRDRFGPLPESVVQLIDTVRLRWKAEELGFEKLSLKGGNMKGYFVNQENERYYKSEIFGKILTYVQTHPRKCRLKDYKGRLILTVQDVEQIAQARDILLQMSN